MSNQPTTFPAIGLLIAALLSASSCVVAAERNVKGLTGPPIHYVSMNGKDYRLGVIHPKDTVGHEITDVPAKGISIHDVLGGWDTVSDADLPRFNGNIPFKLRARVQLFYARATGWLVVPRGWRVQRTAYGADGNTVFSFVAPQGPRFGWMSWDEIPACMGCIYDAAQGLFPGAHKRLDKLLGMTTPPPTLDPRPDRFERLDPTTVRLAYRISGSPPVRSIDIYQSKDDPSFCELALAVPESQSKVAEYLLTTYLDGGAPCR